MFRLNEQNTHRELEQNQADLFGRHGWRTPIVTVKLQKAIARAKLEILEHRLVLEQLERVEHIKVLLFGEHERIAHQLLNAVLVGHNVERVRSFDGRVFRVVDDCRRKIVERNQIGQFTVLDN